MTSRITRAGMAAALTCLLLGAGGVASAHHSFAPFDLTTEKTVTGTVNKVDWTNPHIWVWVDVKNAGGGTDTWAFEGMSPNFLARRGWTRSTLKPGAQVTVSFRPMKDGKNGGMLVSAKLPSGTVLTMMGAQDGSGQ